MGQSLACSLSCFSIADCLEDEREERRQHLTFHAYKNGKHEVKIQHKVD
jgi:hypothetical protein